MTPEGSGEGIVGRRVSRNYSKGPMDKTTGEGESTGGRWVCMRGGVGKWGEIADNYN